MNPSVSGPCLCLPYPPPPILLLFPSAMVLERVLFPEKNPKEPEISRKNVVPPVQGEGAGWPSSNPPRLPPGSPGGLTAQVALLLHIRAPHQDEEGLVCWQQHAGLSSAPGSQDSENLSHPTPCLLCGLEQVVWSLGLSFTKRKMGSLL